uniref:Leucine rich pentatricopeptide repeat containing n=1 Tax=Neogobius melanostomus TaxID=47308 RepID=A0A8C6WJP5_9GOBI
FRSLLALVLSLYQYSLYALPFMDLRLLPYTSGFVRNYALVTERRDESSTAVRSKQAKQFDWAMDKFNSSVRRTGRITKTLLLHIFHDICRTGYPSGNQALLLLRSCGALLPEVPPANRSELAHHIWEKLQELGAQYDVSHYNALLKVYLQNEFKFSPMDFLAKMQAANILPNRVTYQRLIAAYCRNGDIDGASAILGFMKSKDLPITEAVFNSLITGHACAGDIESAKNILTVMRNAGIEPGPDTYVSLLEAYAQNGDMENVKATLETAESADCSLMDRDIMQVIFTLVKAGHHQHAPEMVERLRHERGYIPDAMNMCLSLITHGHEDTAFHMLKSFPTLQMDNVSQDPLNLGNFFLRHCVTMETPLEKIGQYCKVLQEANLHTSPLTFALSCALETRKTSMSIEMMKMLKDQKMPVRPHFFWPLLTPHVKDKNTIVKAMDGLGVDPDVDTLSNYVFPAFPSMEEAQHSLKTNPFFLCVSPHPEETAFFLYNLIESLPKREAQAQEEKLRKYFSQLREQNITISANIYRGISKLLEANNVPELIKVFSWLNSFIYSENTLLTLEKKLEELKSENKPLSSTLKEILLALSAEENLQRALELKQQHEEEMTVPSYAILINLCCLHDNAEEALNLKREMSRKDSSMALDTSKYIALVRTLSKNGKVEVDILKEMKEKDVVLGDTHVISLFHIFNSMRSNGGPDAIRRLQNTIFTLGLAKPTTSLCSPLITAYLDSNDLPGALDAAMECQKLYKQLPRIHDIVVALVEQGDTEKLQKVMDFVSQERGEMRMLYDLFFAFLQTGRYREARKIIETPGIRARQTRLQWFAEKCVAAKRMEPLEQMVEITAKLFDCDRDEMYSYILRLCKDTNDWQKAEATWTKMQEENMIPREKTLHLLADILRNNGQEVPFKVPEVQLRLQLFCNTAVPADAYELLKDIDKSGVSLNPATYDQVIRALLAVGEMEDAMVVKDMYVGYDALLSLKSVLESNRVPSHLAVRRLLQALSSQGNLASIQEVENLMKELSTPLNLSPMLFINNTALAQIHNGDVDSAVEMIESIYTNPNSRSGSISYVFRKVLENGNDEAFDKLSAMAERLANHFACYRPALDIFLELLDMDKVDDAKFMLCLSVFTHLHDYCPSFCLQLGKVKNLVTLIPDFVGKEVLYSYLMKCHDLDKDLESAKALYEQMQKEGVEVDELSLKRLASLYCQAGETVPFIEPPVSMEREAVR